MDEVVIGAPWDVSKDLIDHFKVRLNPANFPFGVPPCLCYFDDVSNKPHNDGQWVVMFNGRVFSHFSMAVLINRMTAG